jgi:RHS repeat-associated protein
MKPLVALVFCCVAFGASGQGAPVVVEHTGEATYSYAIDLPPARGSFQPSLILSYRSSNQRDVGYGVGWSLSVMHIEKIDRRSLSAELAGSPAYHLIRGGVRSLLVPSPRDGPDHYNTAVEAQYFGVTWDANQNRWVGRDAAGTTYLFSCQEGVCSRWFLDRVVDRDQNVTQYSYQTEASWDPEEYPDDPLMGALLKSISYNGFAADPTYAGPVPADAAFATTVELEYVYVEEAVCGVQVVNTQYVSHDYRLSNITVKSRGSSAISTIRTYTFSYSQDSLTGRGLLASIVETGGAAGGPSLPPTSFAYNSDGYLLSEAAPISLPAGAPSPSSEYSNCSSIAGSSSADQSWCSIVTASWVDIDGDNRPDLVWPDPVGGIRWARNVSVAGSGELRFDPVRFAVGSQSFPYHRNSSGKPFSETEQIDSTKIAWYAGLMDFDGDGAPDLINAAGTACGPSGLEVRLAWPNGGSTSYGSTVCVNATLPLAEMKKQLGTDRLFLGVQALDAEEIPTYWAVTLIDITSDGVLDYVVYNALRNPEDMMNGGDYDDSYVFPGYRSSLGQWAFGPGYPSWGFFWTGSNVGWLSPALFPADINADGIVDLVYPQDQYDTWAWSFFDSDEWMFYWNTHREWGNYTLGHAQVQRPGHLDEHTDGYYALADLNGDWLPDIIVRDKSDTTSACPVYVYWNTGQGFSIAATPVCAFGSGSAGHQHYDILPHSYPPWAGSVDIHGTAIDAGQFIDVDADGVGDYVLARWADRSWQFFRGVSGRNTGTGVVLTSVTTSLGARYDLTYAPATTFGGSGRAGRGAVVTRLVSSGPAMATNATAYWYSGPVWSTSWYDPAKKEYRGFTESWAQDGVTQTVRHSVWEVYSYAFAGEAALVELGTSVWSPDGQGPPAYSVFQQLLTDHTARGIGTGRCSAMWHVQTKKGAVLVAAEIDPANYPVTPFASRTTNLTFSDGISLSSESRIACDEVDAWGNVLKVSSDPDLTMAGDETIAHARYWVEELASATCKGCVVHTWKTDVAGNLLGEEYWNTFDEAGHLAAIRSRPDGQSAPAEIERRTYNGNGTIATITRGTIMGTVVYDAFQLRVSQFDLSDGATTLRWTSQYDDLGRMVLATGPGVVNQPGPVRQQGIAYDAFGRAIAFARRPIVNGMVEEAVAAFDYNDFSAANGNTPASVRSYSFTVPVAYPFGSVPQSADVRQSVVFLDGLGRAVQRRDRLGGSSDGDPAAQIAQNLGAARYLVSATVLDGAGRQRARLAPFYAQAADYQDYTTAGSVLRDAIASEGAVHATIASYDAQSRPTCSKYMVVADSVPGAAGACVSSFGDDPSYARATAMSYQARWKDGRAYLGMTTIPAEVNNGSGARTQILVDSAGRPTWAIDPAGNTLQTVYDLLSRPTAQVRQSADGSKTVATTMQYDYMGRLVQRADPDFGTRSYVYDLQGNLLQLLLPPRDLGHGMSAQDSVNYGYSLGRPSSIDQCTATAVTYPWGPVTVRDCVRAATLVYDTPFGDPYGYTAGEIAAALNDEASIAFGYDTSGSLVTRDEWFAGMEGGVSVDQSVTLDGLPLRTNVTSPASAMSYWVRYDSLGQPVQLDDGGGVKYWSVLSPEQPVSAYDATGRLRQANVDDDLVKTAWTYGAYSRKLRGHTVTAPFGPVYSIDQVDFQGRWLKSFVDEVSQTKYSYEYSSLEHLVGAAAAPTGAGGAPPFSEEYAQQFSFNLTKAFADGSSVGNLERVADAGGDYRYMYEGAGIASGQAPGPDAVTTIQGDSAPPSTGSTRFSYDVEGRLTKVHLPNMKSESIAYDALGSIVRREVDGAVTYYAGKFARLTAAGCFSLSPLLHFGSLQVDTQLLVGAELIGSVRSGGGTRPRTLYLHRDRLGSVVATTLGGGLRGANYRFGPYGEQTVAVGENADTRSDRGYTGALRLTAGLVYLADRVYDPALRRFLQADGVEPSNYSYAGGDPINSVDPTGNEEEYFDYFDDYDGTDYYWYDESTGADNYYFGATTSPDAGATDFGASVTSSDATGYDGGGWAGGEPVSPEIPGAQPSGEAAGLAAGWGGGGGGGYVPGLGGSIGEPGFWGSLIPFYGSGRSMIDAIQRGNWGSAALHGALLVSDCFLAGVVVKAVAKGALKLGLRALGRFFYDRRTYQTISRQYWKANGTGGKAAGRSLHHWLIPQRAERFGVPRGLVNGRWNMLEIPAWPNKLSPALERVGGLNQWMGLAQGRGGWQGAVASTLEWGIRAGVMGSAAGAGYGGYRLGEWLEP